MKIRELAEITGLSVDTIRFYEKRGLLDHTHVQRQGNNYRDYRETAVTRLRLIRQGKRLGFTLAEIQQEITAWESDRLSIPEKVSLLQHKITLIDEQVAALQQTKAYLQEKIDWVSAQATETSA
ncbi:MAG: MerR family transcriptional regulator [Cyanobacteria bacterium P01_A01_bin.70]